MGPMYSLMHDADDDGNVVQEIVLVDHTITALRSGLRLRRSIKLDLSTDTTEVTRRSPHRASTPTTPRSLVKLLVKSDGLRSRHGRGGDCIRTLPRAEQADNMDDAAEVAGTYDGRAGNLSSATAATPTAR